MLERAVHRCDGRRQDVRDFTGREREHLAHDDDGSLAGREVLQRGDEGELDGFALRVAGLGACVAVLDAEPLVRVRLDPHGRGKRIARVGLRVRCLAVTERERPLRTLADHVQADVGGDLVEPRAQVGSVLEARQSSPGAEQRVLERVFGVVDRAEHPVRVRVQLVPVRLDEAPKCVGVTVDRRVEQRTPWARGR